MGKRSRRKRGVRRSSPATQFERKVELDGEAELQHGAAMADAAQALIRPRVGSNELGNGTACVLARRGRSREVEARGNGGETAVGGQHSSGDDEQRG